MFLLRHGGSKVHDSVRRCGINPIPSAASLVFITKLTRSMSSSSPPVPPPEESLLDFTNVFTEENKETTIKTIREKTTGFKYRQTAMMKRAAVLIPICRDVQGNPSFLYTLRSLKLSNHRGEICFPGGTSDPEDNGDPVITALRETEEELGISRDDIEIWTILNPMPTASSLMGVTPVLGFLKNPIDPPKLHVNPDEVETAFTINFAHLCDKRNWGHTQYKKGFGMPVYKNMKVFHPAHLYSRPDGLSGSSSEEDADQDQPREVKLWGLTAILTHVVLDAIAPHAYKRHVPLLKASSTSPFDLLSCSTTTQVATSSTSPGSKL